MAPPPNPSKPGPRLVQPDEDIAIKKSEEFSLERFRSKRDPSIGGVETLLTALPTQNLDNAWNFTNVTACETAIHSWVKATSRRAENVDGYLINHAQSPKAFPEPKWPKQSLNELIKVTFAGRMID